MTQTVRHMGYGIDLNLSEPYLGHPEYPGLWGEIYLKYVPKLLMCTYTEGGQRCPEDMYVQIRDGKRVAVHKSLAAAPHATQSESPLHKALKERVAGSAQKSGLDVFMEDAADDGARITDVLVSGSKGRKIGWEIQLSGISPRKVLERSALAHRDGITPQWTVTNPSAAPINRAPWSRIPELADWRMAANRQLAVQSGVRKIVMRDCEFTWFERCPLYVRGGPRFCGKRHASLDGIEVQLDDLIVWSAEGLYVPLYVAAKGAYMWVTANDKAEFLQGRPEELPYSTPTTAVQVGLLVEDPKPLDLACHYGEESDVRKIRAARDTPAAIVLTLPPPTTKQPTSDDVRHTVDAFAAVDGRMDGCQEDVYDIPGQLIEIQRTWNKANAECQRLSRARDPESVAAYDAAWDTRMAATKAKLDHPWLLAQGSLSHARDHALRVAAVCSSDFEHGESGA